MDPPRPQKYIKSRYRKIVAVPGVNLAPKFVLLGNSKDKYGKETLACALIMYNLETSLATTVDKACWNASEATVERFIKPRASTILFR